ncbi:DUF192 domain-containing protein [bacterium]|nr:DUF192 domain-containing protein [bacterium]
MKNSKAYIKTEEEKVLILENCMIAENFWERFKGLMMKPDLKKSNGLLIEKCNSIHNCFMRFPIDAIFLDDNDKVVETKERLKPWFSLVLPVKDAAKVLEVNAEFVKDNDIKKNDQMIFEE